MSSICLILSGAALLVNGLGLLGRIPGRDSATFSVLIGGLQLVLATAIAVTAGGALPALYGVSGVFLFGLTYLYVGIDGLRGLGGVGVGWFCGLVAAIGVVFVVRDLATDPFLSVLWLTWAVLWGLFFVLLALGRASLTRYIGWALVITGPATTVIPALLGLTNAWPVGTGPALVTLLLVAAGFAAAIPLSRPRTAAALQPQSV